MISVEEILSTHLGSLEFEANAHLYQWSGDLVEGAGKPVHTNEPETVEQSDITDWGYHGRFQNEFPYPDRSGSIRPAPNVSADVMRRRIFDSSAPVDLTPSGFSRPTEAAAFELQQGTILNNPLLDRFTFPSLNYYSQPEQSQEPYFDGAYWALNAVSLVTIGFELFKQAELLKTLGVNAAAEVLYAHISTQLPLERLEAVLQRFREGDLKRVDLAVSAKMQRISQESYKWVDACKIPVVTGTGEINLVLSTANIATTAVALNKLGALAIACYGFGRGAKDVVARLTQ